MTYLLSRRPRKLGAAILGATLLALTACCGGASDGRTTADEQMPAVPTSAAEAHVETGRFGDTVIPANPERIAAFFMEDNLSALGITPIVQSEPYDYLGLNVPVFDLWGNLEGLLQAQPDLILMSFWYEENKLGEYAKIAPTHVFDWEWAEVDWRAQLRDLAKLLRKEDKAEQALEEYEAKAEQTKAKLKAAIGDKTVAFIRVDPGRIMLYGDDRGGGFVGPIVYGDLTLSPPELVKQMTWGKRDPVTISTELIPQLNADYLFVISDLRDEETKKEVRQLFENPVWQTLEAVKQNHVFDADSKIWLNNGIHSNEAKLEALSFRLVK